MEPLLNTADGKKPYRKKTYTHVFDKKKLKLKSICLCDPILFAVGLSRSKVANDSWGYGLRSIVG